MSFISYRKSPQHSQKHLSVHTNINTNHSLSLENLEDWNTVEKGRSEGVDQCRKVKSSSTSLSSQGGGQLNTSTPISEGGGQAKSFGAINFSPIRNDSPISRKSSEESNSPVRDLKPWLLGLRRDEGGSGGGLPIIVPQQVSAAVPKLGSSSSSGTRIMGLPPHPRCIGPGSPNLSPRWKLWKRNTCPNLLKAQSTDNLYR